MSEENEVESLRRIERSLGEARFELAIVKLAQALKYSPDQPRVPAGNPDGGQWTNDGGGSHEEAPASDANVILAGGFTEDQLLLSVRDFASRFCEGQTRREIPGQFLGSTIKEVMDAAKAGDSAARKCLKILGRDRFRK